MHSLLIARAATKSRLREAPRQPPPVGIIFALNSFSGTTSGGFAAFSNLGWYTLSTGPDIYNGNVVNLVVTFTLPSGISGGAAITFVPNLFGNVNTTPQGAVPISFPNPT